MRKTLLADVGIPDEVIEHVGFRAAVRHARHRARARRHRASRCPSSTTYAGGCGTTGSATSTRTSSATARFEGAVNGQTVVITGASSGIGRAAALKIAARGRHPAARRARRRTSSRTPSDEIEAAGGTAYVYTADLSDLDAIEQLVAQVLSDHPAVDMLVNNAGPLDPPLDRAQPTTASTTSSARCSSTTSARSS